MAVLMILGYLVFANLVAFAAFGLDKRAALRGGWRTSEHMLLKLALVGGWPGAKLGQRLFRHKTRKQPFGNRLNLIPLWQGGIAVLLLLLTTSRGREILAIIL